MHSSWAAYHANKITEREVFRSISGMLPLFTENSHSPALMVHSMRLVIKITQFLNPGQNPVMTVDQTLYAIAKRIQWTWPNDVEESKMIILMGGLHIEMALGAAIGRFLDNSGWAQCLEEAAVTTAGRSESLLTGHFVKRTRYGHEVSVCALYLLLIESFESEKEKMDLEFSCKSRLGIPQFRYWYTVMYLELLLLEFVRTFRHENVDLYVVMLETILPCFFALNRTNYSRRLPIHIRDLKYLPLQHPALYSEFKSAKCVVHNSVRRFSGIPIDQAHEQNNKLVKGDGGIIGITGNEGALDRWIMSGPEVSRLLNEFHSSVEDFKNCKDMTKHHEESATTQISFRDVVSLKDTISHLGNPFLEEGTSLVQLHTGRLYEGMSTKNLNDILENGEKRAQEFISQRINSYDVHLKATIKKNQDVIFAKKPA